MADRERKAPQFRRDDVAKIKKNCTHRPLLQPTKQLGPDLYGVNIFVWNGV